MKTITIGFYHCKCGHQWAENRTNRDPEAMCINCLHIASPYKMKDRTVDDKPVKDRSILRKNTPVI